MNTEVRIAINKAQAVIYGLERNWARMRRPTALHALELCHGHLEEAQHAIAAAKAEYCEHEEELQRIRNSLEDFRFRLDTRGGFWSRLTGMVERVLECAVQVLRILTAPFLRLGLSIKPTLHLGPPKDSDDQP